MMLKEAKMNKSFLDYLLEKSFVTISDLATKGYSSINDDKYKKILKECGLDTHTVDPVVEVEEYYKKSAAKRTKREN